MAVSEILPGFVYLIFTVPVQMKFDPRKVARYLNFDFDRSEDSTVLISGIGRSGTTWVAEVLNSGNTHRLIDEPFFPTVVSGAGIFQPHQYVTEANANKQMEEVARRILAGKLRSSWCDRHNLRFFSTRRIVKDVRVNLMLPWLISLRPGLRAVLLIRHPLAVFQSWKELGWCVPFKDVPTDFQYIVQQRELFREYSAVSEAYSVIDPDNYFDQIVFLWGCLYFVPLSGLPTNSLIVEFYEDLVAEPFSAFRRIFDHAGIPFDEESVAKGVCLPSHSNFNNRRFVGTDLDLVGGWKNGVSSGELERMREILSKFGLEDLYDPDGYPSDKARITVSGR